MNHRTAAIALAVMLSAAPAGADILVGIAGPITGANAAFGAQLKNGVEQAVEDINAKGGIKGEKIRLVVGDDVSDPKQGVSVANKFASQGVQFVIGHFSSGVSIPASDVYAENGIVQVTPASTNPNFTERGLWNTFRACGRDDQQGKVAAAYILANHKGRKVAFLHDKTTYGKGLADETLKNFKAGGGQEILYEGVNNDEKDFSALVSKLKSTGAELVYWGGLHTQLGLIIRQGREQGIAATFMGADGIVSDEFAAVGGPGVEGTMMTFPPDPRLRADAAAVVKAFEAKKFNPEAYTLYAYASVEIVKAGIEKAGSTDGRKVAEALKSGLAIPTVIGQISYNAKGDRNQPDYTVYKWQKLADGRISYLEWKP